MSGLSRIGSNRTLYKCLKELEQFGYIDYTPSHSSHRPGRIRIKELKELEIASSDKQPEPDSIYESPPCDNNNFEDHPDSEIKGRNSGTKSGRKWDESGLEISTETDLLKTMQNGTSTMQNCTSKESMEMHNCTCTDAQMHFSRCTNALHEVQKCAPRGAKVPTYIRYKTINYKTFKTVCANVKFPLTLLPQKSLNSSIEKRKKVAPKKEDRNSDSLEEKRKKVALKKEKKFVEPELQDVISYFSESNCSDIEARRFFFHFESIGWKIQGKTPLIHWQSAAQKWMLNIPAFQSGKENRLDTNQRKNYAEPL